MKLILNCKCRLNFHKKKCEDIKVFDNLVHTKLIHSQSFLTESFKVINKHT